jgi:hypothetical protein
MPSARLGARGLGGKKTELTANRSHAAQLEYAPALRHALDDKPAKLRQDVKKFFYCDRIEFGRREFTFSRPSFMLNGRVLG